MMLPHRVESDGNRQRDTRWVYAMWALRIVCAPNPAIHFWNKTLSEIQEFACDETLVDQRKVVIGRGFVSLVASRQQT